MRPVCLVWWCVVGLMPACSAQAAGPQRSRAIVAEFKREHPCPSTGHPRGPCPGWQVDHIEPLCAGGRDATDNMQWLSVDTHKAKTRKDVAACFGRVYRQESSHVEMQKLRP